MATRPWMPLYIADYLADTSRLSTMEHGAYLLLIMEYWQAGGLPTDEKVLQKICRVTPHLWRKIFPAIRPYFDENWRHKRIDAELNRSREISEKRAANARNRWGSRGANAPANASDRPDANADAIADANDHANDHAKRMHRARVPQSQLQDSPSSTDSPKPPREPAAKADVLAVKKKICSAFEANQRLPPQLGQVDVWIAQGFSLDLIEAVVVAGLQARPNVSNLKYFDQALTDAAAPRVASPPSTKPNGSSLAATKPAPVADPDGRCVKVGGPRGSIPWSEMRSHVAKWLDDGYWPVNLWEFPGKPSSPVTPVMLETMKSELSGARSQ